MFLGHNYYGWRRRGAYVDIVLYVFLILVCGFGRSARAFVGVNARWDDFQTTNFDTKVSLVGEFSSAN